MELQAETRNGMAAACAADSSRCPNKESEFGRDIMEGDWLLLVYSDDVVLLDLSLICESRSLPSHTKPTFLGILSLNRRPR